MGGILPIACKRSSGCDRLNRSCGIERLVRRIQANYCAGLAGGGTLRPPRAQQHPAGRRLANLGDDFQHGLRHPLIDFRRLAHMHRVTEQAFHAAVDQAHLHLRRGLIGISVLRDNRAYRSQ